MSKRVNHSYATIPNRLTKSPNLASSTRRARPTRKHIFVVRDGFISSLAAGFHTPRTSLVIGVMNPDPFPYIII